MPAPTSILSKQNDLEPYFGVNCEDDSSDVRLLWNIQKYVEAQARKFVGHGITQESYTEFYRSRDIGDHQSENREEYELIGDKVYTTEPSHPMGHYLILKNSFVRSVSNVYEDYSAEFGAGSSDFDASTELTYGTDYTVDWTMSGLSKSGRLIRINRAWSNRPGTIKVVYTAGFAPSELDGDYSYVKMALLEEIAMRYNRARSQRDGGYGQVKKITIFGDIQREFAVDTKTETRNQLSFSTMTALMPIKGYVI